MPRTFRLETPPTQRPLARSVPAMVCAAAFLPCILIIGHNEISSRKSILGQIELDLLTRACTTCFLTLTLAILVFLVIVFDVPILLAIELHFRRVNYSLRIVRSVGRSLPNRNGPVS